MVRALKGLESVISLSVVDPLMTKDGWHFSTEQETKGCIPDPNLNAKFIREIYLKANLDYSGRFTVPVLFDKKLSTIVNNESSEIIRMLNSEFDQWSSAPGLTFYPENLRKEIDEINDWVYNDICNG
jgi:putative glutathione S-transferase